MKTNCRYIKNNKLRQKILAMLLFLGMKDSPISNLPIKI